MVTTIKVQWSKCLVWYLQPIVLKQSIMKSFILKLIKDTFFSYKVKNFRDSLHLEKTTEIILAINYG